MLTERRVSHRLFAAFFIIATAFVASGAYANWLSLRIDRESATLVTNAMPSIARLGEAAAALRSLEVAVEQHAGTTPGGAPTALSRIDELRGKVRAELSSYRSLPTYPGEDALYQDVPSHVKRVDEAIAHVLAETARDTDRARAAVERELRPSVDQANSLLGQLIRLNRAEALDGIARIQATRGTVGSAALTLDLAALLLTIAMAAWLWSLFRAFSRLQVEHARLLEQRAQELEMFGSRVAHELLSPLSSLMFCLGPFRAAAERDPKLKEALRRSRQCVARARELVTGLFEFARSGGAPAPGSIADVAEVLQLVIDECRAAGLAERADIDVAPVPICSVACTSGVLGSILGNLTRNALTYMADSTVRRLTVRVSREGDHVCFEVEDTGPGIPPGMEEAIFEPYARGPTSMPGLGLGLATVKRLCDAHGGRVGVRPAPEVGAVFAVTLPIAREEHAAPPRAPERGDRPAARVHLR